jgi:hypothetical protein
MPTLTTAQIYAKLRRPITAVRTYVPRERQQRPSVGVPPREEVERQKRGARMTWLLCELDSYRRLEVGWDGYGGVPASKASVTNAIYFLITLPSWLPLPEPMIGSDGVAGLFWDCDGQYASIDFPGNDTYCFITDGVEQTGNEGVPIGKMDDHLMSMLRRIAGR